MEQENIKAVKKTAARSYLTQNISLPEGKLPPQAIEVEQAVLGALMLDSNALLDVVDVLKAKYFYRPEHQKIYQVIIDLFSASTPVDILTVTQELKTKGELEIVGGAYYISGLTARVSSAAHTEAHAKIVQQKYIQRELIRIGGGIVKDAYEETTDILSLLDDAEGQLLNVSEDNFRTDYTDMSTLIKTAVKEIEDVAKLDDKMNGVPSGFIELDRKTNGWQKGNLLIVAARPGMGKTAFALTMARNIAVDFKKPVAFFSLEMSAIEVVTRLISIETMLKGEKLKKGDLDQGEWDQLYGKIDSLVKAPLYIDETPALTMFELRAKCRRLKMQHDIGMVMIDYLQLMRGGSEYKGNREQEISNISRQLKGLAKELKIPIMALSQLSRNVESRGGTKRPQLSDLRESGAIEQDADMVMFIYRPEYYKITEDENHESTVGKAWILIEKHRSGSTGDVKLRWIREYAKFDNDDYIGEYNSDSGMLGSGIMSGNSDFDKQGTVITVQSKMNDMPLADFPREDNEDAPY